MWTVAESMRLHCFLAMFHRTQRNNWLVPATHKQENFENASDRLLLSGGNKAILTIFSVLNITFCFSRIFILFHIAI